MNEIMENKLSYLCTIIEYTARKTKNHRRYIVEKIGEEGLERELDLGDVNSCLSFEQVSDEYIEAYKIENGDYDTVSTCMYEVPYVGDIGCVYRRLICSLCENEDDIVATIMKVFTSFISDEISEFNAATYYSPSGYILESYKAGYLLEN